MGVTLERVQNKFACIIGELCNEPYVLSKFAIWVDLRIAEYKANGAIQLDCTGDNPNPLWLKGMGPPHAQITEALGRNEDLKPSRKNFLSTSHPQHPTSESNERLNPNFNTNEDDLIVIKTEPADVYPMALHTNTDFNRKRRSEDRDVLNSDNSIFPPVKSRRFSPVAKEETESFLSVIGVPDQPSTSHAENSDNFTQGMQDFTRISGDFNTSQAGNSDDPVLLDQSISSTHLSQNSSYNQIVFHSKDSVSARNIGVLNQEQAHHLPLDVGHLHSQPFNSSFKDRESTMRNTRYAVKTFEKWLYLKHGIETTMEQIPHQNLDVYLAEFFMTAKQSTGEEYRHGSIRLLRERFERHLKLQGYPYSLVTSTEFLSSQLAFRERKRQLKLSEQSVSHSGS